MVSLTIKDNKEMVKEKKKVITEEKRKFQRLKIPLPVKFIPKDNIVGETFCQDISGGGVRLRLNKLYNRGERLKIFLYFPNDRKPISAIGRVIWCKEIKGKGKSAKYFDTGIQHVHIVPKDRQRFVFLFCEMMINYFILGRIIFKKD